MTQRRLPIVQQEKMLKSAVSDYIDRIVGGRGLRQRVITQPRPICDIDPLAFGQRAASIGGPFDSISYRFPGGLHEAAAIHWFGGVTVLLPLASHGQAARKPTIGYLSIISKDAETPFRAGF